MAFNSNVGRQSFTSSGGQTDFDFNFKIYDEEDIKVYLTPIGQEPDDTADILTYGSDYTVSIDGDDGGVVTLLNSTLNGDILILERELPRTRDVSYVKNGDLKAATLNEDQDYQTYLLVDDFNTADRSLSLPSTDVSMSPELPSTIPGSVLVVNSDGTKFEYSATFANDMSKITIVADSITDVNTVGADLSLGFSAVEDNGYISEPVLETGNDTSNVVKVSTNIIDVNTVAAAVVDGTFQSLLDSLEGYVLITNNLSDLENIAQARVNLDVYSKSETVSTVDDFTLDLGTL